MNDTMIITTATMHWLYSLLRRIDAAYPPLGPPNSGRRLQGDDGAVSLEQVLWFAAAGVSVAAVAFVMWTQIKARASVTISVPQAP